MAHAALHFALGMTAGTLAMAPALRRTWREGKGLAPAMGKWLAVS